MGRVLTRKVSIVKAKSLHRDQAVPKPVQRTGQNNPYTWEALEDGKWWHYVSPSGLAVLKTAPDDFGKDEKSEYPRPPAFDGKKIIRMANSRKGALNYELSGQGGSLLVIDPKDLRDDEWFANLRNANRIVLGAVAARVGWLEVTESGSKMKGA
jgi:hypothetical protein